MMKKIKTLLLGCAIVLSATSCFEDLDDNAINTSEITDFVWKGMNAVYLYKANVPDLANDRFNSNEEYTTYLSGFDSPEDLFESLKFLPNEVDRFSRIYSNYFDLQNSQNGNSLTNGLEFNLYFLPGSETEIFGAITLVLNNSVADNEGLDRGMIFRAIDGENLNISNINELLNQTTYTLNLADYNDNDTNAADDDTIIFNGENIQLTQQAYTENPVHRAEILNVDNTLIGYLVYNGFNNNFDNQLNNAFGNFQNANVSELVVDLRYNGGGSVQTAAYLASMITGQFTGDVFSKLVYNENLSNRNRDFLFTSSFESGGSINSLNLTRVYVLTTNRRTASASELLINSLEPYIDVVVIGENTVGKTQASITIYDSPNLTFEDVNPNHTYAMQPLVANSINTNDQAVPSMGLTPDIFISEFPGNLGSLGDVTEPLLREAIFDITGTLGRSNTEFLDRDDTLQEVDMTKLFPPLEQEMYIDKIDSHFN